MNTEQKSYGQIGREAFMVPWSPGLATNGWDRMANAVLAKLKERELVEGWRLLENGEQSQPSDEVFSFGNTWQPCRPAVEQKQYHNPVRRHCRYLRESLGEQPDPHSPQMADLPTCEMRLMREANDKLRAELKQAYEDIETFNKARDRAESEMESHKNRAREYYEEIEKLRAELSDLRATNTALEKDIAEWRAQGQWRSHQWIKDNERTLEELRFANGELQVKNASMEVSVSVESFHRLENEINRLNELLKSTPPSSWVKQEKDSVDLVLPRMPKRITIGVCTNQE